MVTGADGFTLHVTWMSQLATNVWSILYAPYDTRARQWTGPDQVVWQGGATANDSFLYPDIDLLPDGNPIACCTTGATMGYQARFKTLNGSTWGSEQRINADTHGVYVNVQVDHAGDSHFVYRTNTGLYGVRYRRWDRAAGAWGGEGEAQVWAGTATSHAFSMDGSGTRYVLYVRSQGLWLAVAQPGSVQFTHHQVNGDTGVLQGNNIYYHFTIGDAAGVPWMLYSYRDRNFDEVFGRAFIGGSLTPEVSFLRQQNRRYDSMAASRRPRAPFGLCLVVTSEDVPATTKDLLALTSGAGYVPLGDGCAGSGGFVPQGTALGLPALGNAQFALQVVRALGGTAGLLFIGTRDDLFGSLPLPLDLTGVGMPGCFLRTNLLLALVAVTSGSGPGQGQGSVVLPVPNDVSLRGARLFGQWLVLDQSANAGGFAASSAGAIVVR
jgi:hypothetical protein